MPQSNEPIKKQWSMPHVWISFVIFSVFEVYFAEKVRESDVTIYRRYAHEALMSPLLHHWPNAYPALSLGVFLLPRVFPLSYRMSFALTTIIVLGLLLSSGSRHHGAQWGMRLMGYLAIGSFGLFSQRYDIFAAAMGFWAVSAARQHQWLSAWVYSILGFLLKMWPAVLWPIFLIQERRETGHWRFDRLLSAITAEVVVILGQFLLDPDQMFSSLKYLLYRPVNIASTPGVLARWLGDHHLIFAYGAVDVIGPLPTDLATAIFFLGVLLGLGILWLLAKGSIGLTDSSILAVGLLLVAMKVSSPQYLIWWAPLLALRRGTPILLAAFALTMLAYPLETMLGLEFLNLPTLTMVFLFLVIGLVRLFLHRDTDPPKNRSRSRELFSPTT